MKPNPRLLAIEENMRQGTMAAYNFLGQDPRSLAEILEEDHSTLARLDITHEALGEKMQYFTERGKEKLGQPVVLEGVYEVLVEEHKGRIPCPFQDNHGAVAAMTTVTHRKTKEQVSWSDLNIHLILEHQFYEGRGAAFRVDPVVLCHFLKLGS